MWLMIAIALITETILVNNGVEIAVMMAIIVELSKMEQAERCSYRRIKVKFDFGK